MRGSQGGDPAGDLAGRGGGLYFSASVGILKIRRAVQREKVCGRGIQPFSPVVSPEGGQSPLLMLAGAGAAEKVLRRDSVYLGFLAKAGREGAEVLCGRVWRQKTCNWGLGSNGTENSVKLILIFCQSSPEAVFHHFSARLLGPHVGIGFGELCLTPDRACQRQFLVSPLRPLPVAILPVSS